MQLYIPSKYWRDEVEGPLLAVRFAEVIESEGFPVLYDKSGIECLWYKHIYQPLLEKERELEGWYEAEYTKEQLVYMSGELLKLVNEIQDGEARPLDGQLLDIIRGYNKLVRGKI